MLICHIVYLETSVIQLPSKINKRGRPKGGDLTIIGLPKKKKDSNKPVAFLKLHPKDQEKGNDTLSGSAAVATVAICDSTYKNPEQFRKPNFSI